MATIWGTNRGRDSDRHTVAVHVLNLHSKPGDSVDSPKYIGSVRGMEYKFLQQVTAGAATRPEPPDAPTNTKT